MKNVPERKLVKMVNSFIAKGLLDAASNLDGFDGERGQNFNFGTIHIKDEPDDFAMEEIRSDSIHDQLPAKKAKLIADNAILNLFSDSDSDEEGGVNRFHFLGFQKPLTVSSLNKKNEVCKENKVSVNTNSKSNIENNNPEIIIASRDKLNKCSLCNKSFNHEISLSHHIFTVHGSRPFDCSECTMNFTCKSDLTKHFQFTHGNSIGLKILESYSLTDSQCYGIKQQLHYSERARTFSCPMCDASADDQEVLAEHIRYVHSNICSYEMNLCQNYSNNISNDSIIMATSVLEDLNKKYILNCSDCDTSFLFQQLQNHIKTVHCNKSLCCSCDFKGNLSDTIVHAYHNSHLPNETRPIILGTDDGEKNVIIGLQPRVYLKAHHTLPIAKQATYECLECCITFPNKYYQIKHSQSFHEKTEFFACLYCDTPFKYESPLVQHVLSAHSNLKPFRCLKCYKGFMSFKCLTEHLRLSHEILDPVGDFERDMLVLRRRKNKSFFDSESLTSKIIYYGNLNKEKSNIVLKRKVLGKLSNCKEDGSFQKFVPHPRRSAMQKSTDSKCQSRVLLYDTTIAENILKYLNEMYTATCSKCCLEIILINLTDHIKSMHPDACLCCSCGFQGELASTIVHSFRMSHLPNEMQPIVLKSVDSKCEIGLRKRENVPKVFPCYKCSKIFTQDQHRQFHYKNCKSKENISCDICDETFALSVHLQRHKVTKHKTDLRKCSYCNKAFNSDISLSLHVCDIHKKNISPQSRHKVEPIISPSFETYIPGETLECNQIAQEDNGHHQIALTESDLNTSSSDNGFEEEVIMRSRKCRKCNDIFNTSKQLKVHARIHAGEKPHSCLHCTEMFISRNLLLKHMLKIHNKLLSDHDVMGLVKRNKYQVSDSSDSSDSDELQTYPNLNLKNSSENELKNIVLTISDLSTSSSDADMDDTSFLQCKECDDYFTTYRQLKVHLRIHNGNKPHACYRCSQTFISRNLLLKHRLVGCNDLSGKQNSFKNKIVKRVAYSSSSSSSDSSDTESSTKQTATIEKK